MTPEGQIGEAERMKVEGRKVIAMTEEPPKEDKILVWTCPRPHCHKVIKSLDNASLEYNARQHMAKHERKDRKWAKMSV